MRRIILTLTAAAGLGAAAARAQEPPVCDAVLVAFAEARLGATGGPSSALHFLREDSTLAGLVAEQGADGSAFVSLPGGQRQGVDVSTTGAFRHQGCAEVTGVLRVLGKGETLMRSDGQPAPVSIFVFGGEAFFQAFEPGASITETNARLKVGALVLEPQLIAPGPDELRRAPTDPFRDFTVSAYITQNRPQTLIGSSPAAERPVGDHQWFAIDLRQGRGRQLAAIACDRPCVDYLDDYKLRLLAANGPAAAPLVPPTAPEPRAKPDPEVAFDNFDSEGLTVIVLGADGQVLSEERIDLAARAAEAGYGANKRLTVRAALEMLLNDSEVVSGTGRRILTDQGWLDETLADHALESAERGYRLVLRAPKPPEQPRLTGVDLVLDKAKGNAIFAYCTLLAEITHPEFDPVLLDMEIDFDGAELDAEGNEIYGRLSSKPDQQALIPDVPYDSLSLRLFAREQTRVVGGTPARPSSCALDWSGYFPHALLPLSEVAAGTDLPVALDADARIVVSGATLSSTARPVFAMVYNVTGLQDSNGAPLTPAVYPKWNYEAGGSDLQSALRILSQTVHQAFAGRTEEIFLAGAAGGGDKGFLAPEPFAPDSPQRVAAAVKPGEVGPDNLGNELRNLANSTTSVPRFVIVGRSGLPAGTDYCATPPEMPADSLRGSVVIDFLGKSAASDLPVAVQEHLGAPVGSPEFTQAARRLAALCPEDGSGLRHWVLTPDFKESFRLIGDLETLAPYLFGGLQ